MCTKRHSAINRHYAMHWESGITRLRILIRLHIYSSVVITPHTGDEPRFKEEDKTMNDNATNSAFPMFNQHGECIHDSAGGLTKREYFAAMALQGILSTESGMSAIPENAAKCARVNADTLLIELARKKGSA